MKALRAQYLAVILSSIMLGQCASAVAEEKSGQLGGWQINAGPSLWGPGVTGDIGVGTMDGELGISFHDIIDQLNVALSGRIDARKGPWKIYADGLIAEIEANQAISPGTIGPFTIGNQTFGPFTPTAQFDFTQDVILVEAGAAYRIGTWALSSAKPNAPGAQSIAVDILAGARYTDYETEVDFKNGTTVTVTEDWIDPYVGTDLDFNLSSSWDLRLHLDVGGFGVGSDFTYNTWGVLTYSWAEKRRAFFGYRVMYQDYEEGVGASRFKWDATMHGPVVGMEFRF